VRRKENSGNAGKDANVNQNFHPGRKKGGAFELGERMPSRRRTESEVLEKRIDPLQGSLKEYRKKIFSTLKATNGCKGSLGRSETAEAYP